MTLKLEGSPHWWVLAAFSAVGPGMLLLGEWLAG
jgi:hypothetical protein